MTPDGGAVGLLTHPSLVVRNADEAMQVFFLVECGLLRPRPRPLTPEEARYLGHGAVLVWQDDLCSSDVWNQVVFRDGHDWEPPFLRYGMYNFRHRDESSRLWKFLFTAKRNVLYDNAKYWHMLAYYDGWEFAAQLQYLSEFSQYVECVSHMPPTYFTPEWALGKLDVAPQLPVDVKQAINSLANRIEYPRYNEYKMDGFRPRPPLARTKINCIIQEADVPLDPSMYAKRNKGIRLEDFGSLLPDEQDTLGSHSAVQRMSPAGRIPVRTISPAMSEALRNIIDDLLDASLATELVNDQAQENGAIAKALSSLIKYVSAQTAASAPPTHRWDHLMLFEASIDSQESAGVQTFVYVPSKGRPARPTDWRTGYGLLFVLPRLIDGVSSPGDKHCDLTSQGPFQISGGDLTGTVTPGSKVPDDLLITSANHPFRRIDALTSAMLRACPARTHVFSLIFAREERRLCFYYMDRSRSVFSNGARLHRQKDEEFEMLVVALLGVLSGSHTQYGLHESFTWIGAMPDTATKTQLFSDMSSLSVKVGPRTFQLGRRVDIAPHKGSFEASRYLARLIDGPALASQAHCTQAETGRADALVSFRWVPVGQDEAHNEVHLLRLGYQRGAGEVAAVYDSQLLSDCSGWSFSSAPMRHQPLLLVSVMEPLVSLDEVRSVDQFKIAFISIIRAHHCLYDVGILHDKITPRSLMVKANDHGAGVLVGSGRVIDALHPDGQYPSSESEIELAWDSLFSPTPVHDIAEDGVHSDPVQYHLQLESFFYALVWMVSRGVDAFNPAAWLAGSEQKRLLISTITGIDIHCEVADRAALMRSWVVNLAHEFDASFKARERWGGEPHEDLLDGEPPRIWVTYDRFMDILMQ